MAKINYHKKKVLKIYSILKIFFMTEPSKRKLRFLQQKKKYCKNRKKSETSISSLFGKIGASMRFLSRKLSDSTSNVCPVIPDSRSQCLRCSALLAIISKSGQVSLKSSIVLRKSS